MFRLICGAALLAANGSAYAAITNGQVNYGPPGTWVVPQPAPTAGVAPHEAPMRFVYSDQQVRISAAGEETYSAYRLKILKPEALQIGNVRIAWNPAGGAVTVHHLRIIRDGETIDVLKSQAFQVIQREGRLEESILDGQLTAMLQAPGLRVGDELEFAVTIRQRDPILGDHAFGFSQLPTQGTPGNFRFRLNWPAAGKITWRATRDLPQAVPTNANGQTSIEYQLRDPGGVIVNDGAPARYNIRRLIEFSDFASWSDVSKRFAPLFEKAATLASNSPLRAEAAKIATSSADPTERAQAALRLVQDQIRYVFVGLDGGNYRPTSADETWQRRFGDCKAKTAILLALLRELRIEAEPVLVNALGEDGADGRLPSPAVFNHILVRATVDGKSYWLDATRLGDRYLDMLPAPSFRWALAISAAGSNLEAVPLHPLTRPQFISVVDIDASSGFGKAAQVNASHVLRDDEAYAIRSRLVAMSPEDAERAVRAYWRRQLDWVEPDSVSWRYDERRTTLLLSLNGAGPLDWDGDDSEGRSLAIIGAGFYPPDLRRRPKEQDQSAPWTTEYPRFRCFATSIRLPADTGKWRWAYDAEPMDRRLGGTVYWRASGLKTNLMRTVMSSRIEQLEIGANEAKAVNDAIPSFNNKRSQVYQVTSEDKATADPGGETLPFAEGVDWMGAVPVCSAPSKR